MAEKQEQDLLSILKNRFKQNSTRHEHVLWDSIEPMLVENKKTLKIIEKMENTGGEPDVILFDNVITFCDCARESPAGRRSLCYDNEALLIRKENKPSGSAIELSKEIGITILNENYYKLLQKYVECDLKTSSWIETPLKIRKLGGALFGDRRYNQVFIYHNGAESYYSVRGFRGYLEIGKA
jgi:hypothetical protein